MTKITIFIVLVVFALAVTSAPSAAKKFLCTNSGWFADPDNCHNFHICAVMREWEGLVDLPMKCPAGMAFDSADGFCSKAATRRLNC